MITAWAGQWRGWPIVKSGDKVEEKNYKSIFSKKKNLRFKFSFRNLENTLENWNRY